MLHNGSFRFCVAPPRQPAAPSRPARPGLPGPGAPGDTYPLQPLLSDVPVVRVLLVLLLHGPVDGHEEPVVRQAVLVHDLRPRATGHGAAPASAPSPPGTPGGSPPRGRGASPAGRAASGWATGQGTQWGAHRLRDPDAGAIVPGPVLLPQVEEELVNTAVGIHQVAQLRVHHPGRPEQPGVPRSPRGLLPPVLPGPRRPPPGAARPPRRAGAPRPGRHRLALAVT